MAILTKIISMINSPGHNVRFVDVVRATSDGRVDAQL